MSRSVLLLFACAVVSSAYLLPGIAPVNYKEKEEINVHTTKLTSVRTQLPYDHWAIPFCSPSKIQKYASNLGEVLRGDRITNSLYNLQILEDVQCQVLGADFPLGSIKPYKKNEPTPSNCTYVYSGGDFRIFAKFVKNDYRVHWELDNLPAAQPLTYVTSSKPVYSIGFQMGQRDVKTGEIYLNNHVSIVVKYNKDTSFSNDKTMGYRIVGFEVEPHSIDYAAAGKLYKPDCQLSTLLKIPVDNIDATSMPVAWTYSVHWQHEPTIQWSDRWDAYFANADTHMHWFSIINSLIIILFLTGMVAMILVRALHADFRKYSAKDAETEAEESGWKLLHADVFRAPKNRIFLSVCVGFGSQVFAMAIVTLLCGLVGLVSPANKGSVLSGMIALFVLMGAVGGYNTTRLYKMMKGVFWKRAALMAAFLFPGIVFGVFMFIDFLILGQKSSGAIPFGTFSMMVALWFGVSLPLVFVGAFYAYKRPAMTIPVSVINPIPRTIPQQVWYMHPVISVAMGGILPFGAIFIELYFVLTAIWNQQIYYIATFLFIVFVILFITCAEISVVMCYFQLCSEDHHWWWRSFMTSASSAFYLFAYSVFYFFSKLDITNFVSGLMYFGYSFIFAVIFFVLTGFIGFYSTLMFVRKIYASVPLD